MADPTPTPGPWWPAAYELAVATAAAFLAGYVRARQNPAPLSWQSFAAKCAEAIVCGCIAIGISAAMESADQRLTIGISAGLALIGTGVLSDLATRFLSNRAGKA
jgi:hypothetical protein